MTPRDGDPLYGGWPAFYRYFFEKFRWTLEEVNRCPIYLACLLLGAIGPDHTGVRMTFKDTLRYYGNDETMMQKLQIAGRLFGNG